MERKTLSDNIPGLTMPGVVDLAFEAAKSNDRLKAIKHMEDFGRDTHSKSGSTIGTISIEGNMPAGIISIKKSDPKVFISHSSEDKKYAQALVKLLETIGLDNHSVFCSSVPGYGIPLGKDIFEALTEEFNEHALHIIFLLSENYYKSEALLASG